MERNMKTAAAQSMPSCLRKNSWRDSGIVGSVGDCEEKRNAEGAKVSERGGEEGNGQ